MNWSRNGLMDAKIFRLWGDAPMIKIEQAIDLST